jgi:hypothetical protein
MFAAHITYRLVLYNIDCLFYSLLHRKKLSRSYLGFRQGCWRAPYGLDWMTPYSAIMSSTSLRGLRNGLRVRRNAAEILKPD